MRQVDSGNDYVLYAPNRSNEMNRQPASIARREPAIDLRAMVSRLRQQVVRDHLDEFAQSLGLSPDSLIAIAVGWAQRQDLESFRAGWKGTIPEGAWVFPELDGKGELCGFSLRAPDGRKSAPSAKTGARRGLVMPVGANLQPAIPIGKVLIVEGATDVAAAFALGIAAVGRPSNTGGTSDLGQLLRDRDVLVLGENDRKPNGAWPGSEGARRTAAALTKAWEKDVLWALPPRDAKDLRAWLCAKRPKAGSQVGTNALQEDGQALLSVLIASASVERSSKKVAVSICFKDIAPQPVRWLWEGRIPLGKLSLIAGDPSVGKSIFTCDLAASVSRGITHATGGTIMLGEVLILSAEDDPADTIQPRLVNAGADLNRLHFLRGSREGGVMSPFNLARDIDALDGLLDEHPEMRLVVVDPISAYLGETSEISNAQVRSILSPLSEFAARRGVAVLAISHLNKAADMSALYRTSGSLAFVAAPRAAFLLARHPESDERRVLVPLKFNVGPMPSTIAFGVVDSGAGPKLAWEMEPVDLTAEGLLRAGSQHGKHSSKLEEAAAWLAAELFEGPRDQSVIEQAADAAGFSKRTLQRAKKDLDVASDKQGMDGGWRWQLPKALTSRVPPTDPVGHVFDFEGGLGTSSSEARQAPVSGVGGLQVAGSPADVSKAPSTARQDESGPIPQSARGPVEGRQVLSENFGNLQRESHPSGLANAGSSSPGVGSSLSSALDRALVGDCQSPAGDSANDGLLLGALQGISQCNGLEGSQQTSKSVRCAERTTSNAVSPEGRQGGEIELGILHAKPPPVLPAGEPLELNHGSDIAHESEVGESDPHEVSKRAAIQAESGALPFAPLAMTTWDEEQGRG